MDSVVFEFEIIVVDDLLLVYILFLMSGYKSVVFKFLVYWCLVILKVEDFVLERSSVLV